MSFVNTIMLVFVLCPGILAESLPSYTLVFLAGNSIMPSAMPANINNNGQIVGYISDNNYSHRTAACMWDSRSGKLKVILGGDYSYSRARSINDEGVIVGDRAKHPFIWQKNRATILADSGLAYGINNKGDIVGELDIHDVHTSSYNLVLWHNKSRVNLGTLGGRLSWARGAHAINNRGAVVGTADVNEEESHAFIWQKGKIIDLEVLGKRMSGAESINNKNDVVGNYKLPDGTEHAFLWSNYKVVDLGTPPREKSGLAIDINDADSILMAGESSKIYIWHKGEITDVSALIQNKVSWTYMVATAMNNNGQIIGTGKYKGRQVGFVLNPISKHSMKTLHN